MVSDAIIPFDSILRRIYFLRGHKVILGQDLSALYGVQTKVLMQAVRRNIDRFPEDFAFELTKDEYDLLRSQIVTLETGDSASSKMYASSQRGRHPKYLPYAFTEHGVAMLSSVLKSERAIQVNIAIMRAFGQMRQAIETHRALAKKLGELEAKLGTHDAKFKAVFTALHALMVQPEKKKRPIGFGVKEKKAAYRKAPRKTPM